MFSKLRNNNQLFICILCKISKIIFIILMFHAKLLKNFINNICAGCKTQESLSYSFYSYDNILIILHSIQ